RPGCGTPGAIVQVTIDGQPAYPTITWGGQNQDLGLSGRDVTTISPPPGDEVTRTLADGWNDVAQLGPSGDPALVLGWIPGPWTAAYWFDTATRGFNGDYGVYLRYFPGEAEFTQSWLLARTYDAFWVHSAAGEVTVANPQP